MSNLALALQAAGGTLDDMLSRRISIVASAMAHSAAVREGLQQLFPTTPPTATWIGVPCLAHAHGLIEIKARAVLQG